MLNQGRMDNQKGPSQVDDDNSGEGFPRGIWEFSTVYVAPVNCLSEKIDSENIFLFLLDQPAILKFTEKMLENAVLIRNGTKANPAITCFDLFAKYPSLKSDMYWIDPDSGNTENAILVYCDRDTKATCLVSQPSEINVQPTNDNDKTSQWLSSRNVSLSYKVDGRQIRHLQLLSNRAVQSISLRSTVEKSRR